MPVQEATARTSFSNSAAVMVDASGASASVEPGYAPPTAQHQIVTLLGIFE